MSIAITRYDTTTLLGVMRHLEPPNNYWLQYFPSVIQFDTEYVDFSQIAENRKLAPLVVPTARGKPIWTAAEKASRVKPAYIKAKDPVSASRVVKRVAGFGELSVGATPMSPAQRYNMIIADILLQHRKAIERRWEWLAAQAVIYGKATLESDDYPKTIVDFGRAADQDIVLTTGSFWSDAGVSIVNLIEAWKRKTRIAKFGGVTNRITMGADAYEALRKNSEILDLLTIDKRPYNNGLDTNLGVLEGLEIEYVGKINGTTELVVYSDYYELEDGTVTPFMDPRDIVMTSPSIGGVQCFGSIQDKAAGFLPLQIFPKMWDEEDPSTTFVMSQSAPLMVPVMPNATLHARVVA